MSFGKRTRRHALFGFAAFAAGLLAPRRGTAAAPTPAASEGPFYPRPAMRRADTDNDLVKVAGLVREAGGEVILLKGRITGKSGAPRPGLRIEIWQCDANGSYLHPGDRGSGSHDQGFQGFGHDITGADGSYRFRTIRPARYPGRTPHIHVKVLQGTRELLTTQFYLKDHPGNARDGLFRRLTPAQAAAVSMEITPGPEGPEATVDVVI